MIGAFLLLLLLLLLIWLLICCCRKRRYEKEVANEIRYGTTETITTRLKCGGGAMRPRVICFREDTKAPESRPTSRQSSLRSILGYRTHAGLKYESPHNVIYTGESTGTSPPPTVGEKPRRLDYDHRFGYPV